MSIFAILGADDPEMGMMKSLLSSAGISYGRAHLNGAPVRPHEAYVSGVYSVPSIPEGIEELWLIECQPDVPPGLRTVVVDHHRPGDPGYGMPPEKFLEASSVGQVFRHLTDPGSLFRHRAGGWFLGDVQVPEEIILCAAADHCLAAAYHGECPGVEPDALMEWRASTRAAFQRRPVEAVLADIRAALERLKSAPRLSIGGVEVADLREAGAIPELPEAAARAGMPFLACLVEKNQRKLVLQSAPPQAIKAWMEEQHSSGRSPYGDPARGFAGVILP